MIRVIQDSWGARIEITCDRCHELVTDGVSDLIAWHIEPDPAQTSIRVATSGELFHLHAACYDAFVEERGGRDEWRPVYIKVLSEMIAKSLGIEAWRDTTSRSAPAPDGMH